jgi:hypothetical protein
MNRPLPDPASKSLTANPMGLVGFILSVIGLISCGTASILGLVFSLIGLRRQPKQLAIAGTIISIAGMVMLSILITVVAVGEGKERQKNARIDCMRNVMLIEAAKQSWALENGKSYDDEPTWDELLDSHLPKMPRCPGGGTYTLNRMVEQPECSIEDHQIYPRP